MLRLAPVIAVVVATALPARADVRAFTRTYEYGTQPEGKTAVELWHTQGKRAFEGALEIEHGLTEHWDAGLVTVVSHVAADDTAAAEALHLASVRLESRYRFADRAEWPVDLQLMLVAGKAFGRSDYAAGGRVIAARDFDRITVAANATIDVLAGAAREDTEVVLGWAAGATYSAHAKVRLGAETWGQAVVEGDLSAVAGPTLGLSPTSTFWITATAGFGLVDDAPDFEARAILGLEL